MTHPMGIDIRKPGLSWTLVSGFRGQMQSAYQILAASDEEKLRNNQGDLWDTGKVESDQSIHVEYDGKPLQSGMRCWWKVRVWDAEGIASEYSEPGWWEMGLLDAADWKVEWIGLSPEFCPKDPEIPEDVGLPCPHLRKPFTISKTVKRARVYVTALGLYEL